MDTFRRAAMPTQDVGAQRLPQCDQWRRRLEQVAAAPLGLCPEFPRLARRHEAWWACELDRPLFLAWENLDPARPLERRVDLLRDDPEAWFTGRQQDLRRIRPIGDAPPVMRLDMGPASLAAFVGARREVASDTVWTEPFIADDWSNAGHWSIDEDNIWWQRLLVLLARVAEDAAGRYLVCAPDLGGSIDALLGMRGSEALCLDALEQPEKIRTALEQLYPLSRRALEAFYEIATGRGAGVVHWLDLWTTRPSCVPTCDFNAMLGPRHFEQVCLPDIRRLAGTVERCVFHLDGPDAARHINALLDAPEIHAIQFTPGSGTPSALPWIDMLNKIQRRGRAVMIFCPAEEVPTLIQQVEPRGLALAVDGGPDASDAAFAAVRRRFGQRT